MTLSEIPKEDSLQSVPIKVKYLANAWIAMVIFKMLLEIYLANNFSQMSFVGILIVLAAVGMKSGHANAIRAMKWASAACVLYSGGSLFIGLAILYQQKDDPFFYIDQFFVDEASPFILVNILLFVFGVGSFLILFNKEVKKFIRLQKETITKRTHHFRITHLMLLTTMVALVTAQISTHRRINKPNRAVRPLLGTVISSPNQRDYESGPKIIMFALNPSEKANKKHIAYIDFTVDQYRYTNLEFYRKRVQEWCDWSMDFVFNKITVKKLSIKEVELRIWHKGSAFHVPIVADKKDVARYLRTSHPSVFLEDYYTFIEGAD